jgi:hypothetical protein
MSLGLVLGWKFSHASGISTQEQEDGNFAITGWPDNLGPLPTAEQIATWSAEYGAYAAVPQSVTRTQALLALLDDGITEAMILAQIEAVTDEAERERARIRFTGPVWERDSDLLTAMAAAFGLNQEQVDGLFIAAGQM